MESKFKVGQRVECLLYGWGTVMNIQEDENIPYPIKVKLDSSGYEYYNKDGIYITKQRITLSPYGWEVKEKEPEFKEGELVWVKQYENDTWHCRYYSHKDGVNHHCFINQEKKGSTYSTTYIKKFDDIPF